MIKAGGVAGWERAGWALAWWGVVGWWGGKGLEGAARGPRGGGGTCMFIPKIIRRNRVECRSGAEYQGKNPVFFTGFFPWRYRIFPRCTFFPRKKSGKIELVVFGTMTGH